jgi:excisionase family DNA binding protein
MEKEVLNVKKAAEFLGFTEYTIREHCKAGKIPAKKVGGEWRFLKSELISWLREGEKKVG